MAQIVLYNVSNDQKYFPQRRDMFNEARWTEAKRLMAQVLRQHSKEAGRRSSRFLQDRMAAGDFPAPAVSQRHHMYSQQRRTQPAARRVYGA
jgi:hypothetical protein